MSTLPEDGLYGSEFTLYLSWYPESYHHFSPLLPANKEKVKLKWFSRSNLLESDPHSTSKQLTNYDMFHLISSPPTHTWSLSYKDDAEQMVPRPKYPEYPIKIIQPFILK